MILCRIADYFVQNRRFFLQESQIFCTFALAKVRNLSVTHWR